MMDISGCRDMIPKKYFEGGNYEDDKNTNVIQRQFSDKVPLDYAFARWMPIENGLAMMPGTNFQMDNSESIDNFVRVAICKTPDIVTDTRIKLGL